MGSRIINAIAEGLIFIILFAGFLGAIKIITSLVSKKDKDLPSDLGTMNKGGSSPANRTKFEQSDSNSNTGIAGFEQRSASNNISNIKSNINSTVESIEKKDNVVDKTIRSFDSTIQDPPDFYAQAWEEVEQGTYDKGTWAKAYAEHEGDEVKTKASYIRNRVVDLEQKYKKLQEQIEKEVAKKKAVAAKEAAEAERIRVKMEEKRISLLPEALLPGSVMVTQFTDSGVRVNEILHILDSIAYYNDQDVRDGRGATLLAEMSKTSPSEKVPLVGIRDGQTITIHIPGGKLNIEALGSEVLSRKGILVTNITDEDSEKYKLLCGDVIFMYNNKDVRNDKEGFLDASKSMSSDFEVPILVVRGNLVLHFHVPGGLSRIEVAQLVT